MRRSARVLSPPISRKPSYQVDTGPVDSGSTETPTESTPLIAGTSLEEEGSQSVPIGAEDAKGISAGRARSSSRHKSNWETFATRSKYYVPGLEWIPNYSMKYFWGDLASGLTVASILIPQSMSYATSLAHLDASTGLFASAIPGVVYALFGTCKQLNVGPEAALSLLVGQAVTALVSGDPHQEPARGMATAVATIITFQVGLISFLLGLLRLGFIDVILSRALLRGFITAVAVVIMVEQLVPMLGLEALLHSLDPAPHSTFDKIMFLVDNAFTHGQRLTAAISFTSLVTLIIARALKKRIVATGGRWTAWVFYIPEIFILVVVSTILSDVYEWDKKGVTILGNVTIDTGTLFELPLGNHNMRFFKKTASTAILISVAGFLDSVVAAKQNSGRFGYSISPNRELVALGAGNLVSSFFPGTLPAYGAITRSKLNGDTGGRTQMASLVCSATVVIAVIFLLPALTYLPKCVLAAIIGLVVNSILAEAPHDVGFYWKMSAWTDISLMILTFFFTVVWSVEVGIIVSVTVSLLLVVRRSSKPHIKILGRVPGTERWKPVEENPEDMEEVPGVLIVRLRESLDFANTGQIKDRLRRLELYGAKRAHPSEAPRRTDTTAVVFHMADVEKIDASATQIFLELTKTYKNRDVQVHFAHLHDRNLKAFREAGIIPQVVPDSHLHENVAHAMFTLEQELPSVSSV